MVLDDRNKKHNLNRRAVLTGVGAGATGTLGGCIGDDGPDDAALVDDAEDEDDIDVDPGEVVDQTFVLPTEDNPEEGSIVMRGPPMPEEFETRYGFAGHVYRTMHEPALYGRVFERAYTPAPGDIHLGVLDDIEVLDDRFRFTIRDDAYWSDGEPIRAMDGGPRQLLRRTSGLPTEGQWLYDEREHYDGVSQQYVDLNFPDGPDGKVWELLGPPGHENIIGEKWEDPENRGWVYLRVIETDGVANFPSHIEPYNSLLHDVLDEVERGMDGEEVRHRNEIVGEHIDESTFEKFRDPENVITSGPWTLSEIRGAEEWVLEPNEHHRAADDINFSEIRMPWIEEDHRLNAELQAGRPDYGQLLVDPDLVNDLEQQNYTQELSPVAEDGGNICFRQNHPVFGNVKVRQAIGYAIDQYAVAETVHPDITFPVDIPMGDMFGRDAFISDDWVDENLREWPQDLDKAEDLMHEAGLERGDDDSWLHEGSPIEEIYPSREDAPIEERIVVDQLNEFGFNLELLTMEDDIYVERFYDQDFGIFPGGDFHFPRFQTGHIMRAIFARWINIMTSGDRIQGWMMYEPEEVNYEIAELLDDFGWQVVLDDHVDPYIEIPPVGEWDAEPEPFYIADRINEVFYHGDATHPDYEDTIKKLAWASHWFVPAYQMFYLQDQHFVNRENWVWPTDHPSWDYFGEALTPADYLSLGKIQANPESPK